MHCLHPVHSVPWTRTCRQQRRWATQCWPRNTHRPRSTSATSLAMAAASVSRVRSLTGPPSPPAGRWPSPPAAEARGAAGRARAAAAAARAAETASSRNVVARPSEGRGAAGSARRGGHAGDCAAPCAGSPLLRTCGAAGVSGSAAATARQLPTIVRARWTGSRALLLLWRASALTAHRPCDPIAWNRVVTRSGVRACTPLPRPPLPACWSRRKAMSGVTAAVPSPAPPAASAACRAACARALGSAAGSFCSSSTKARYSGSVHARVAGLADWPQHCTSYRNPRSSETHAYQILNVSSDSAARTGLRNRAGDALWCRTASCRAPCNSMIEHRLSLRGLEGYDARRTPWCPRAGRASRATAAHAGRARTPLRSGAARRAP